MTKNGKILAVVGANLGVAALIMALMRSKGAALTATDVINYLGAVATTYSFALGAYFALLAVNAYAHALSIGETQSKVTSLYSDICAKTDALAGITASARSDGDKFRRFLAEAMDLAVAMAPGHTAGEREEFTRSLMLLRARYGFKFETDQGKKLVHARTLIALECGSALEDVVAFLASLADADAAQMLEVARRRMKE